MSWAMKITNQEVFRVVHFEEVCLLADIRKKKMGYFGQIIRLSTLLHALLAGEIKGRRNHGRPRRTIRIW